MFGILLRIFWYKSERLTREKMAKSKMPRKISPRKFWSRKMDRGNFLKLYKTNTHDNSCRCDDSSLALRLWKFYKHQQRRAEHNYQVCHDIHCHLKSQYCTLRGIMVDGLSNGACCLIFLQSIGVLNS